MNAVDVHDGQSDQALTDRLQSIIDLQNAADNMTLCDRLQRMISSHTDVIPHILIILRKMLTICEKSHRTLILICVMCCRAY